MKTRGRPSKKVEKEGTETAEPTTPKVQLTPDATNPPKLFILPENISKEARIVTLEDPRYASNNRYVVCPERGFYEFTRIAAPKTTPRSWLLSLKDSNSAFTEGEESVEETNDTKDKFSSEGYVMRNADLFVATPIDPLFFVIPALAPVSNSKGSEPQKKLFLSGEDYLERITSASPQINGLLKIESLRILLEKRMAAICDTVDAGDETMYRLSEEKMFGELLRKAKKIAEKRLTASMEEKFIRKALEVPILAIKRDDCSLKSGEEPIDSETPTPLAETTDTQSTISSVESATASFSDASTAATSFTDDSSITVTPETMKPNIPPPVNAPEGVEDLLRLRTALDFICLNYVPPHLVEKIKSSIKSPNSALDFAPLEAHLSHLAKLRQDALSVRSLGEFSRKRNFEDDEDGESRAEKKQRKEEEEKRKKAGESRGVRNLKKVNVNGMKKMSDFFKKK